MSSETLEELFSRLLEQYQKLFEDESKNKGLFDKKGKVIAGREQEERGLKESIKSIKDEIKAILDEWTVEHLSKAREQTPLIPSQLLIFEPQIDVNFGVVKDAYPIGKALHSGRLNVPIGQVFVFGNMGIDEGGFSEVYLGRETILPGRKDRKSLVAVLAEVPGEINCMANQWLAGISVSKDNVAKVSLKIPIFLNDPVQVLKRSGGAWMSVDGRKNIDHDNNEQIEHRLQEIMTDRIQFWSGEPHEILDRVCTMLNRDLSEWGLLIKAESISIIRQLPKTLYEIVTQFSKAEQAILDSLANGRRTQVIDQSSLTDEDLTFIEAASERENAGRGEGLFMVLRDRMSTLASKPDVFTKLFNWIRIHGGASAVNYASEIIRLYGRTTQSDFDSNKEPGVSDIKLSEQVLLSAFRNSLIGLGEMIEGRG